MIEAIIKIELPPISGWQREIFKNSEHGITITLDDEAKLNIKKVNVNTGEVEINEKREIFDFATPINNNCIHSELCKKNLCACPCNLFFDKPESW